MKNVLEYLERSAREYPEKTAAEDPQEKYTYYELKGRARRIGSALLGSGEEEAMRKEAMRKPVVVYMEKSVKALASMMGIVYAGCFYTYISPEQPAARIKQILEVLQPDRIITGNGADQDGKLAEAGFSGRIYEYDVISDFEVSDEMLNAVRTQALDIDPLYCNFTSGSTGVPKGVLISHRSVIDFMNYFPDMFHITKDDVIGNQAPFDFDVSVKDIYSAFRTGATLTVIPKRLFSIPMQLLDYLCERNVTTLIWAVSALCMVAQLKGFTYRVPEKVNKVLFSGEAMPVKHLDQWRKYLPEAQYVNLYGPTEITCNCTYYRVEREFASDENLPIGRPFPDEKVFLLDIGFEEGRTELEDEKTGSVNGSVVVRGFLNGKEDDARRTPGASEAEIREINRIGEICVSGTALGLGYYNNPVQTAKSFVQNPLNTKYMEMIYRTGDLGYYNEDGDLCFAGRKDFQIKHMGHRIELEEVELMISAYPGIERVCCLFDDVKDKIVAYYAGQLEGREIKKRMRESVPSHMIPQVFRRMEALPLTANGKIDRKKLMADYRSG